MFTSGSLLFALFRFLPLGEFVKRLCSFLKLGNEVLNIIQNVVQDLLGTEDSQNSKHFNCEVNKQML